MRYESKASLLTEIKTEHDTLWGGLDAIPRSRRRDPGVWGDGWCVCDLVAHLAEWQGMFLAWYDDGARGVAPTMPAPGYKWNETPRLNRAIWAKHRGRSEAWIRRFFDAGYRRILGLVEQLPEEALLTPGHYAWTGKFPLTTYLGANTASHYRFAIKVLKRWQAGNTRAASTKRPRKASASGRRE